MQTLDVVRLAALIAAFATSATKLLGSTRGFWLDRLPPWVSRALPGILLVGGALPAALAGVSTWEEFALAVLGAVALGMPGTHSAPKIVLVDESTEPKRITIKPPPMAMLALALLLLSCGGSQPDPRALIDLTPLVCRSVLAGQKVEPERAERICSDSRIAAQLTADIAQAVQRAALAAMPSVDIGGGPSAGGGASSGGAGAAP